MKNLLHIVRLQPQTPKVFGRFLLSKFKDV
jgi:hypothetical protein